MNKNVELDVELENSPVPKDRHENTISLRDSPRDSNNAVPVTNEQEPYKSRLRQNVKKTNRYGY